MTEPPGLPQGTIAEILRSWDPEAVADTLEFRGELTIVVPSKYIFRIAEHLKTEPGLAFDFLSDISTVDRFPMKPRFELNYHLLSITNRQVLRLRVHLSGGAQPTIDTVTSVWPTANWHEREIFDLFGIRFAGHPNLRRILMPEDWEGHPLRRDYPLEGFR